MEYVVTALTERTARALLWRLEKETLLRWVDSGNPTDFTFKQPLASLYAHWPEEKNNAALSFGYRNDRPYMLDVAAPDEIPVVLTPLAFLVWSKERFPR